MIYVRHKYEYDVWRKYSDITYMLHIPSAGGDVTLMGPH